MDRRCRRLDIPAGWGFPIYFFFAGGAAGLEGAGAAEAAGVAEPAAGAVDPAGAAEPAGADDAPGAADPAEGGADPAGTAEPLEAGAAALPAGAGGGVAAGPGSSKNFTMSSMSCIRSRAFFTAPSYSGFPFAFSMKASKICLAWL